MLRVNGGQRKYIFLKKSHQLHTCAYLLFFQAGNLGVNTLDALANHFVCYGWIHQSNFLYDVVIFVFLRYYAPSLRVFLTLPINESLIKPLRHISLRDETLFLDPRDGISTRLAPLSFVRQDRYLVDKACSTKGFKGMTPCIATFMFLDYSLRIYFTRNRYFQPFKLIQFTVFS